MERQKDFVEKQISLSLCQALRRILRAKMYFGPLAPSRGCSDCFVVISVSIYLVNTTQSDNDNNNNNNNNNNAITFQFVTYELRKDRRS